MKKIGLIVVALAILGIGLYYFYHSKQNSKGEALNFASWNKFVPRSRLFSILLPNTPQYAKDFIAVPGSDQKRRYDMYVSEKVDGTLFLISVITYPPEVDISDPDDILRQNVDELMRRKPGNQLLKMLKGSLEEYKTFDFGFENQEFHVEGKAILDDHTVYMLTYIARRENFDLLEYDHFISSFKILSHANQK